MLIPKVANTSIKFSLLTALGMKPTYPGLNSAVSKAVRFGDIIRQADKAEIARMDWLKIGFVRHPLTRFLSFYSDKVVKGHNSNKLRSLGIAQGMTIEQVLDIVDQTPDSDADQHFRSQYFDLTHKGNVLPDMIVFHESLATGWRDVQEQCQQNSGLHLPALRTLNQTRSLREYVSPEIADRIYYRYAEDFELFGYDR